MHIHLKIQAHHGKSRCFQKTDHCQTADSCLQYDACRGSMYQQAELPEAQPVQQPQQGEWRDEHLHPTVQGSIPRLGRAAHASHLFAAPIMPFIRVAWTALVLSEEKARQTSFRSLPWEKCVCQSWDRPLAQSSYGSALHAGGRAGGCGAWQAVLSLYRRTNIQRPQCLFDRGFEQGIVSTCTPSSWPWNVTIINIIVSAWAWILHVKPAIGRTLAKTSPKVLTAHRRRSDCCSGSLARPSMSLQVPYRGHYVVSQQRERPSK
jgi:hypothetical protein